MKDKTIRNQWTQLMNQHPHLFPKPIIKKSVKITKPITMTTDNNVKKQSTQRKSQYQFISRKMTQQSSRKTHEMFQHDQQLWHMYHDERDHSFKGYDDQTAIPINNIIKYLETKQHYRLTILDLGGGRNEIANHFINTKLSIKGYDHIAYNGSQVIDIASLPDKDESIDICIYSQSLMGHNWKQYINEGIRTLRYHGEIIISESIERYDTIIEYLKQHNLYIKQDNYDETNRWFRINAIKE